MERRESIASLKAECQIEECDLAVHDDLSIEEKDTQVEGYYACEYEVDLGRHIGKKES